MLVQALHTYLEDALKGDLDQPTSETTHSDNNSSTHSGSDPVTKMMNADRKKLHSLLQIPSVLMESDANPLQDLNRKIVAAESCWFVARVSDILR
jgi:hypothetical protein